MKVSKGIITLGGHLTLSETLAFKKPAMIFPIADHVEQILNAYTLEGVSYVRYNLKDLRKHIKTFLRNLDPLKKRIPKKETRFFGKIDVFQHLFFFIKEYLVIIHSHFFIKPTPYIITVSVNIDMEITIEFYDAFHKFC